MFDLREESWILISASVFTLLQYVILLEEHSLHGYVDGKGRSTLIAFSDNYGNFSLMLYSNWTKGRCLEASCHV